MTTQIIVEHKKNNTNTHVVGEHKKLLDMMENAAYKDYRIMACCFGVVMRVFERTNPVMFQQLKIAHAGIHPSQLANKPAKANS